MAYTIGSPSIVTGGKFGGADALSTFTTPNEGLYLFDVLLAGLAPNATTISWRATINDVTAGYGADAKNATADTSWRSSPLLAMSLNQGDVVKIYISSSANAADRADAPYHSCTITVRDGNWANNPFPTTDQIAEAVGSGGGLSKVGSDTINDGGISNPTAATSFHVLHGDRFRIGDVLAVQGGRELMTVLSLTGNTVTVARAQFGTTANYIDDGYGLDIYSPSRALAASGVMAAAAYTAPSTPVQIRAAVLTLFQALALSGASAPVDLGGTFDPAIYSLQAIRDRGDEAWGTAEAANLDQLEADVATIVARTNGEVKVTNQSPVLPDGTLAPLIQGDSYMAADGDAVGWTLQNLKYTVPDGTSYAELTIKSNADGEKITVAGTTATTEAGCDIKFDLTSAQTETFPLGSADWDVQLTTANGHIKTPLRGETTILAQFST